MVPKSQVTFTLVYAVSFTLLYGIIVNMRQNGPENHPPPPAGAIKKASDASVLKSKADFVAAWRHAKVPARKAYLGRTFDAALSDLGAMAPVSAFITHVLFGGVLGGHWIGKRFHKGSETGDNRFSTAGFRNSFRATVENSWVDGKPALVLQYQYGDSILWGTMLRMRDELREISPGVWLGLGSMAATGGMANSAPFLMFEPKKA